MGPNFAVLPAAFDAFVTVLVKIGEVLPKFLVRCIDNVSVFDGSELGRQVPDGGDVELVLVRLWTSQFQRASTKCPFNSRRENGME